MKRDDDYNYIVLRSGRAMMATHAPACRYSRETELHMLSAGYTITLNGKKLKRRDITARTDKPL